MPSEDPKAATSRTHSKRVVVDGERSRSVAISCITKSAMDVLKAQLRCNNCGVRLTDAHGKCPSCGKDLGEVGVWSDFHEWEATRRRGRGRYVWLEWVVSRGGLFAVASCIARAIVGKTEPSEYLMFSIPWLIWAYLMGHWYWRSAERQYAAWRG